MSRERRLERPLRRLVLNIRWGITRYIPVPSLPVLMLLRSSYGVRPTPLLCCLLLLSLMTLPLHAAAGQRRAGAASPPEAPPAAPPLPPSLPVPTTHAGLFAARDERAVDGLAFIRCTEQTIEAIRRSTTGRPPDGTIVCLRQSGEWRGIVADLPGDGSNGQVLALIRQQFRLRSGAMVRATDAVDTVEVTRVLRAMRRGLAAPLPGAGRAPFLPIVLSQPTFTEVWFLPAPDPTRLVTGGDSVIQMTPDGLRELGHARQTPALQLRTFPAEGPMVLESQEAQLPLVSELMAAHLALRRVGEVRLRTARFESTLTRPGTWVHRPR